MDDTQHPTIERAYSDPESAHDKALWFQRKTAAYRVLIESETGRFVLTAWFRTEREYRAAVAIL